MKFILRLGLALLMLAPLLGTGCNRAQHAKVLVPVQETPAKQYAYASMTRENTNLPLLIKDKNRYLAGRARVRAAWSKVIEAYPADREFTPLAKLNVIEMDAGLDDDRHAPNSRRRDRRAIAQLEELMKEYPEFDFIQAKSMLDMGLLYKRRGEYEDATRLFKFVKDNYTSHTDEHIKELVKISDFYYNQTYTIGK